MGKPNNSARQRIVELFDQGLSISEIKRDVHWTWYNIVKVLDAERPNRERKVSFDRAKAWALHDAGWTPPDIAQEVGAPVAHVRRELTGERPQTETREG